MSTKRKDLWDYLSSVRLAVALIIILAATSIIGTLIPQNAAQQEYTERFGTAGAKIIFALNFSDMYHSWWFVFLLTLFTVNLILCSVKRLPPVLRQMKNPEKILTEEMEKGISLVDTIKKDGTPEAWKNTVKEFLTKKYGNVSEQSENNKHYLYLEKGRYARLGVYVTHLSILIILVGGLIGSVFGFRGFVNIPEGEAVDHVRLRGGKPPYHMDFKIRCDKFSLAYYPMGMVKEYRSDVTIIEGGREVKKDFLIVNKPLTHKGLVFYQSSYGATNRVAKVMVKMLAGPEAGKEFEMDLKADPIPMPLAQDAVRITNHIPNLENAGPAMILHMEEDGRCRDFPVLKHYPYARTNPGSKYVFKYVDYSETFYTGLQVTKDPGVWVVWTGCFLMMAGMYFSFLVIRKRIWARISSDSDGKTLITLAGHSPRTRIFEEEFAKITEDFKNTEI